MSKKTVFKILRWISFFLMFLIISYVLIVLITEEYNFLEWSFKRNKLVVILSSLLAFVLYLDYEEE